MTIFYKQVYTILSIVLMTTTKREVLIISLFFYDFKVTQYILQFIILKILQFYKMDNIINHQFYKRKHTQTSPIKFRNI
jgi:hypothetical protein